HRATIFHVPVWRPARAYDRYAAATVRRRLPAQRGGAGRAGAALAVRRRAGGLPRRAGGGDAARDEYMGLGDVHGARRCRVGLYVVAALGERQPRRATG